MSIPAPSPEERTGAFTTYLLTAFLGVIGAFIGWIIFKDKGPFAKDQTNEALNWAITITIVFVAVYILIFILAMISSKFMMIVSIVYLVVPLTSLILNIMAAMKANSGAAYRFPFALRLVK